MNEEQRAQLRLQRLPLSSPPSSSTKGVGMMGGGEKNENGGRGTGTGTLGMFWRGVITGGLGVMVLYTVATWIGFNEIAEKRVGAF